MDSRKNLRIQTLTRTSDSKAESPLVLMTSLVLEITSLYFSNNELHYGNLQRIRLVDRLKEDVRYLRNDESVEKRQGRWDVDYGLGSGRFGKRGSEDDYDLDFIL